MELEADEVDKEEELLLLLLLPLLLAPSPLFSKGMAQNLGGNRPTIA